MGQSFRSQTFSGILTGRETAACAINQQETTTGRIFLQQATAFIHPSTELIYKSNRKYKSNVNVEFNVKHLIVLIM
ncbi:hypothetical protein TNCV_1042001 [Trichonephila clavipes]|nr:hypothetical protein TNCV_1042001 [Trichonephila clavipes]